MNSILETKNIIFTQADLIGSWYLEEFTIDDLNGKTSTWGENCTGLLLYTVDNHMSVSINRKVGTDSPNEEKNIFDSILFYAGTFKIDRLNENDPKIIKNPYTNSHMTIKHSVLQASDPNRIGQEFLRYVGYEVTKSNNVYLTLSSSVESFGRGAIRWKKI